MSESANDGKSRQEPTLAIMGCNVRDFGAKGDYDPDTETGTDDTAAFQAALEAAGEGGLLLVPQGHYLISEPLVTPPRSLVRGMQSFLFGAGPAHGITLHFRLPYGATAVTLGKHANIEGVILRRAGAAANAVGLRNTSSGSQLRNLGVYGFYIGIMLEDSFYTRMINVETAYCRNGLWLHRGIYNLDLYGCVFRKTDHGIRACCPLRGLNLYGGSVEHFRDGGIRLDTGSAGSVVNLFGVYFEGYTDGANAMIVSSDNNTFNMTGNMVYLSKINVWFDAGGRRGTIVNAHGNKFRNRKDRVNRAIAYVLPAGGYCRIYGDSWCEVDYGTYIGNAELIRKYRIDLPEGAGTTPDNACPEKA